MRRVVWHSLSMIDGYGFSDTGTKVSVEVHNRNYSGVRITVIMLV